MKPIKMNGRDRFPEQRESVNTLRRPRDSAFLPVSDVGHSLKPSAPSSLHQPTLRKSLIDCIIFGPVELEHRAADSSTARRRGSHAKSPAPQSHPPAPVVYAPCWGLERPHCFHSTDSVWLTLDRFSPAKSVSSRCLLYSNRPRGWPETSNWLYGIRSQRYRICNFGDRH